MVENLTNLKSINVVKVVCFQSPNGRMASFLRDSPKVQTLTTDKTQCRSYFFINIIMCSTVFDNLYGVERIDSHELHEAHQVRVTRYPLLTGQVLFFQQNVWVQYVA